MDRAIPLHSWGLIHQLKDGRQLSTRTVLDPGVIARHVAVEANTTDRTLGVSELVLYGEKHASKCAPLSHPS